MDSLRLEPLVERKQKEGPKLVRHQHLLYQNIAKTTRRPRERTVLTWWIYKQNEAVVDGTKIASIHVRTFVGGQMKFLLFRVHSGRPMQPDGTWIAAKQKHDVEALSILLKETRVPAMLELILELLVLIPKKSHQRLIPL
jgi:hypothetical protein